MAGNNEYFFHPEEVRRESGDIVLPAGLSIDGNVLPLDVVVPNLSQRQACYYCGFQTQGRMLLRKRKTGVMLARVICPLHQEAVKNGEHLVPGEEQRPNATAAKLTSNSQSGSKIPYMGPFMGPFPPFKPV